MAALSNSHPDYTLEICDLPVELLEIIFTKVLENNPFEFFRMARTCQVFRDVIQYRMLPLLCKGKMTRPVAVSICRMIEDSVARNWFEECLRYRPGYKKSSAKLVKAFLVLNTRLQVGHPKMNVKEMSVKPRNRDLKFESLKKWQDRRGIRFRNAKGRTKPIVHGFPYTQFVHYQLEEEHVHEHSRAIIYVNLAKETFGIFADDDEYPFYEEEDVYYGQRFKMYDTRSAFNQGHVTAARMFFNTLCLGTSNGRIYCFRVQRMNDLYELDMSKPDYYTESTKVKPIRQIDIDVGLGGTIDISFSHLEAK